MEPLLEVGLQLDREARGDRPVSALSSSDFLRRVHLPLIQRVPNAFILAAGGFGGNTGHDPHMLYTLSAVQILALYGKLHLLDADKVANCKCALVPAVIWPSGSFLVVFLTVLLHARPMVECLWSPEQVAVIAVRGAVCSR